MEEASQAGEAAYDLEAAESKLNSKDRTDSQEGRKGKRWEWGCKDDAKDM